MQTFRQTGVFLGLLMTDASDLKFKGDRSLNARNLRSNTNETKLAPGILLFLQVLPLPAEVPRCPVMKTRSTCKGPFFGSIKATDAGLLRLLRTNLPVAKDSGITQTKAPASE